MSETSRRLLTALGLGWSLFIAVLYAAMIGDLATYQNRLLWGHLKEFFLWQAVGYLLFCVVMQVVRKGLLGRAGALYLGLSPVALLAFSQELRWPLAFALFLAWSLSTVNSTRLAIERLVGPDQATWGLAAGLMIASWIPISFFLGLFKLITVWAVAPLAIAAALPGAIDLWRNRPGAPVIRWLDRLNPIGAAALGAIWISLAVAFVWSGAPESAADSTRWHLPHIQHMARGHGFEPLYVYYTYLMPNAVQAYLAAGFVIGSTPLAKWLSWFSIVALTMLVTEEVARRSGQINLAAFCGAATLGHPLLLSLSTTLYVDHVVALLCCTAFIALFRGLNENSRKGILLSAFIMGCAVQTKHNVMIFCVIWGIFLSVAAIRRFRLWQGVKWCVAPMLLLGIVACPWYLYTFAITGNPVYPWFDQWFHSPLWPEGMSTKFIRAKFDVPDGFLGWLKFPWIMTFHSSRIAHALDGGLGFLLLALLPFAIAIRGVRRGGALDLGLAGVAIFLGVGIYSPYARYWLSAYPLMLMALSIALGQTIARARWRSGWLSTSAAVVLFVSLLLPIPYWRTGFHGLPWDVYTRKTSEEAWFTRHTLGYPAIQTLNAVADPSDRILASPRVAVHTIDATAQVFPYWHAKINGVVDKDSFDRFLAKNDIRYWVVDFSTDDSEYFDGLVEASPRYWTTSRLLTGSSTVAVYDVSSPAPPPRFSLLDQRVIPPVMDKDSGWRDLHAKNGARALKPGRKAIRIPKRGAAEHRFEIPAGADLFRAKLDLKSKTRLTGVDLTLTLLNRDKEQIAQTSERLRKRSYQAQVEYFGIIPDDAAHGHLKVSHIKSEAAQLRETELVFWTSDDTRGAQERPSAP